MENYIVSARKYRPMSFATVVGQESLTTTLRNTVKSGKLAHAYLFCGPRGVGKTTCARIFAKAINCMNPSTDGEACNECESCKAFNEGRSMNIFELDAASNNSVENIRSLMEQTQIPPQMGRYKVFIIDEVHMLSTSAFNAFLKTLEEPPHHVIFILATTEKHKILPTILSRCQIYDFERMSVPNIIRHLEDVAQKEGIAFEEEALAVIAEKADGGMRDALSIFDQVASFSQGHITYNKVVDDLNVLDAENYFKLLDLSLENKVSDIMLLLNNIIGKGFDPGLLANGFASHVRNVLMAHDEATLSLLETSQNMRQRYAAQAQKCKTSFLYKALNLLNECDQNYRTSSNKRLLVELTLIKVAQIMQPEDGEEGAGRSPKRLKSLFNRMHTAQPKPVRQVTGAVHREKKTDISNNASAPAVPTTPTTTATVGKQRVRLKNLSSSYATLQAQKNEPDTVDLPLPDQKVEVEEEHRFTENELRQEWMMMCNRMPHAMVGLSSRLKNIVPSIVNYPNIEVVVDNKSLLTQVMEIKNKLQATMRYALHNNSIELTVRQVEETEMQRTYTKREVFDELRKRNTALENLRTKLGLELA